MTTDITELAQSLKAAAEKATQGEWRRASTQFNGITATPFMLGRKEVMIAGASEKRDAEFIALANPANILALVETLEKAQQRITQLESRTVKLPRPGFITISGERMAVYLKGDVDAAMLAAGIEEAE